MPGSTPPPTEPSAGYAAWFDAGEGTFQDYGATVPAALDGESVFRWDSRGGSYPISMTTPGGYGACTLKLAANGINGHAIVRSTLATFGVLRDGAQAATFDGDLLSLTQGTVICVVRVPVINGAAVRAVWGEANGLVGMYAYDWGEGPAVQAVFSDAGGSYGARKAVTAGAAHILTWHHDGDTLYCGVDDTRTASMSSVVSPNGGSLPACNFAVLLGMAGPGQYLDGDLRHTIYYPNGLLEPGRQQTERFFAAECGIALPY